MRRATSVAHFITVVVRKYHGIGIILIDRLNLS